MRREFDLVFYLFGYGYRRSDLDLVMTANAHRPRAMRSGSSRPIPSAPFLIILKSYGTRKNFPVYGSFTTDPDVKAVTSIYFPSSGV